MMLRPILAASVLALAALAAAPVANAAVPVQHFASTTSPSGPSPPFSASVLAGDTLYISGITDGTDPATGKLPANPTIGAKVVLDSIKRAVEARGLTMDDLVWVQVFATDLNNFDAFNVVYRTYFKGPLPARAFIGAGSLLRGAHFEVMGVAVKQK